MSVDQVGARELQLFIENDSQLYHQQLQPIQKNLRTKQARGMYNEAKGIKAFRNLADNGARKYGEEYLGSSHKGLETFSPTTRNYVAKRLEEHFRTESSLGNYDYLLPKKYQHKGVQMMERS